MEAEILARSRDLENANRALRQLAVTFERQVEGAPDATVVVDGSGTIVLVNQQAEVMFGYPRQELVGAAVEKLIPESSRDIHVKHRAAYAANPQMRTMGSGLALSGRRQDGTEFPVSVALYCADVEHGLVVASVRDITARQETEAALGRLAAIVKHADDAIFTVTGAGVITAWNQGAERLYGYSEEEITGQLVTLLTPPRARRRGAGAHPRNSQHGPDRARGDNPGPQRRDTRRRRPQPVTPARRGGQHDRCGGDRAGHHRAASAPKSPRGAGDASSKPRTRNLSTSPISRPTTCRSRCGR